MTTKHDNTIQKLYGPDGERLRCQYFVRGSGGCVDCGSTNIGVGCSSAAVYPDKRCCQHTAWLEGTWAERGAADRWVPGMVLQTWARYIAWKAHTESGVKT